MFAACFFTLVYLVTLLSQADTMQDVTVSLYKPPTSIFAQNLALCTLAANSILDSVYLYVSLKTNIFTKKTDCDKHFYISKKY